MCLLALVFWFLGNPQLDIVYAEPSKEDDYVYAATFDELFKSEAWGWHSGKIGNASSNSVLAGQGSNSYAPENVHDYNLKTAWVEGEDDYGIGKSISFLCSNEYPTDVKSFNGEIEFFNGYCKSEATWRANSRVKKFKLYVNNEAVVIVQLQDTWQYQKVNLRKYICGFDGVKPKFVLRSGDRLSFEIMEVYPGNKYKDVAISELVTPSYGGG